jgi:hypothetical protein
MRAPPLRKRKGGAANEGDRLDLGLPPRHQEGRKEGSTPPVNWKGDGRSLGKGGGQPPTQRRDEANDHRVLFHATSFVLCSRRFAAPPPAAILSAR